MTATYFWQAGSGRSLTLSMTLDQAQSCSHPGRCDDDVEYLADKLSDQTAAWDPIALAEELAEYGAWEPEELTDHDTNTARMVWMACCDVAESPKDYAVDPVTVIFRVWPSGGVFALFPELEWSRSGPRLCTSYEHVGQHGGADYAGCIYRTRPATMEEYSPLKAELARIGYVLKVKTRRGRS